MEEGKYEYGRLLDARLAVEQKVNLYGVVTDYAYPKPTRGRNRDFFCAMTIADMSCHSPGLRVLAFGPKENLPRVKSLRDIIRFHRVKMTIHEKAPQAHYIKGSSFVLFHGARNSNDEPYQVSSNTFTFEEYDRQCLELLREWSSVELPDSVSSQYLLHIRDIKDEPTCFDLCCKVLHVDVDEPVIMYVWDGSDSSLTTSLPFVENQSLPVAALRQFPTKGTVLQVIIDMPFDDNKTLWLPQVGTWIKLRNITNRISGGILESVFTFKSKIEIPDCQLIQGIERCYEERLVSSEAGLPENCPKPVLSPTVTDYENVPYSTLREVLASPQVTYKFRCLVRVKSIRPENVGDFCCLFNGKHIYSVQLTLEDPTAQIPAYLFAEDGEKFFNGFPAALRDNDDACLGVLARLVDKLICGAYMKCCIKSYYLNKEEPWLSRRFRIFGTILLG